MKERRSWRIGIFMKGEPWKGSPLPLPSAPSRSPLPLLWHSALSAFPRAFHRSEVEVGAEADVFDLALEELAVGRVAKEVLEEDLHLARGQHAVELHAGPHGEVHRPLVLLAVLEVDGGDRPPAGGARRPRARELRAVLERPRLDAGRIPIEEVAGAAVDPQGVVPELVGELAVDPLVAQVDAPGAGPEQELVAEVTRLM